MGEIAFTAGKNPSVKFTADSSRALRAGKRYGSGWRVIKTRSATKRSTAPKLHQAEMQQREDRHFVLEGCAGRC
jgi:hypothetical protein